MPGVEVAVTEATNYERVWQTALGELEVVLSRPNFITWFKNTFIVEVTDETMVIGVPNSFAIDWLTNKFQPDILKVLKKLLPDIAIKQIRCKITQPARAAEAARAGALAVLPMPAPTAASAAGPAAIPTETSLNPSYTFEHFVVGTHNRLAHAAALAVSSEPGKRHNPLFIYGGVGLGKTHLMQAIGHAVAAANPKLRILYAPCERFANEFVTAIQTKKMHEFKHKYRNVDVLLIDDIQFIAGKDGTQEEFFHTFNTLHQTSRQVVLTSDRIPQAIPELEDRLSSRFVGGMVTDIKNPDLETRAAILKHKCAERRAELPDDVIELLARSFASNIRELEGGLNQILTYCELERVAPTLESVEEYLAHHRPERRATVSPGEIFVVISGFYQIATDDLLGPRRHKEFVYPRQVMMYLMRSELGYSFPQIGRELHKDHTTIMHGVGKIEKELRHSSTLQSEISQLRDRLANRA